MSTCVHGEEEAFGPRLEVKKEMFTGTTAWFPACRRRSEEHLRRLKAVTGLRERE
jgi:hypothetical protein